MSRNVGGRGSASRVERRHDDRSRKGNHYRTSANDYGSRECWCSRMCSAVERWGSREKEKSGCPGSGYFPVGGIVALKTAIGSSSPGGKPADNPEDKREKYNHDRDQDMMFADAASVLAPPGGYPAPLVSLISMGFQHRDGFHLAQHCWHVWGLVPTLLDGRGADL